MFMELIESMACQGPRCCLRPSGPGASLVAQWQRIHLPMQETWVETLGHEDPLEKEMATHFGILAWEIWWTEELGGLQSMGSQKSWTRLCSVAKSWLTLCDPVNCSTPGFLVLHYLLELAQTHVHWVDDAIQLSYPLSPSSSFAFSFSWHGDLFQWIGHDWATKHSTAQRLNNNVNISLWTLGGDI